MSNHGIKPETNKNRLASGARESWAGDRFIPDDAAAAA
jgi:hypothetical protein